MTTAPFTQVYEWGWARFQLLVFQFFRNRDGGI